MYVYICESIFVYKEHHIRFVSTPHTINLSYIPWHPTRLSGINTYHSPLPFILCFYYPSLTQPLTILLSLSFCFNHHILVLFPAPPCSFTILLSCVLLLSYKGSLERTKQIHWWWWWVGEWGTSFTGEKTIPLELNALRIHSKVVWEWTETCWLEDPLILLKV